MDDILVVFVLGGMVAGGMVANASYLPAFPGFALPGVGMLLVKSAHHHAEMALMLVAFTAVLIVSGRNINRTLVANFRLPVFHRRNG